MDFPLGFACWLVKYCDLFDQIKSLLKRVKLEMPLKFLLVCVSVFSTSADRQPIWCRCELVWQVSCGTCACVCVCARPE